LVVPFPGDGAKGYFENVKLSKKCRIVTSEAMSEYK